MLDINEKIDAELDHVWIELTNKCNLTCSHCYANSGPHVIENGTLNELQLIQLISDLSILGCKSIQFIGGEPTIHRSLPILLEKCHELKIPRIEVYSNLFSVPDALWQVLELTQTKLATSVYGSASAVHDRMTNRSGSFEKTISNIEEAARRKIELRVAMIVDEKNQDDIQTTRQLISSIGIQNFAVDRVRGIGRTEKKNTKSGHITEVCGQCWKGKLCIDPFGKLSPCIMSKAWPIGDLAETSLFEVVERGKLRKTRSDMAHDFGETSKGIAMNPCRPNHCGPGDPYPAPTCNPTFDCIPSRGISKTHLMGFSPER